MTIHEELETIRAKHGGTLDPADVVRFAKNPKAALHPRFTWDDSEAAKQYRLWQAREIILRVRVECHGHPDIRAYVSLTTDRGEGGYRAVADVLSKADLRKQLLREALAELDVFRKKYAGLEALAPIFEAMDRVAKPKPKPKRKVA